MPPLPRHDFVLFLCRLIDNTELGDPESRERFGHRDPALPVEDFGPGWDPIVDEFQEVVVGPATCPCRLAPHYRLSFLAAALYNLRLLRVFLHHVPDALGMPLEAYLERLWTTWQRPRPGTVYAAFDAAFDRYIDSLLDGGPFVLPLDSAEDSTPVVVDEAIALIALERYDEFLAETAAITGGNPIQSPRHSAINSLTTPRWGRSISVEAHFAHDSPPTSKPPALRCHRSRYRSVSRPAAWSRTRVSEASPRTTSVASAPAWTLERWSDSPALNPPAPSLHASPCPPGQSSPRVAESHAPYQASLPGQTIQQFIELRCFAHADRVRGFLLKT